MASAALPELALEQRHRGDRELAGLEATAGSDGFAQRTQPPAAAHTAEGHVGMEATPLRGEADAVHRLPEGGVQRRQPVVRRLHPDPEDARSRYMWETADVAKPAAGRLCGASDPREDLVDAAQLARLDVSQELEGQVHRIDVNPTNVGTAGAQLGDDFRQPLLHVIRQLNGDEQAHGNDQDCIVVGPR